MRAPRQPANAEAGHADGVREGVTGGRARATVAVVVRGASSQSCTGGPRVAVHLGLLSVAFSVAFAVVFAGSCAPHESSEQPGPECAEGMARVEGGRLGAREVATLCVDTTEVTTAAFASCVDAGACATSQAQRGERCNLVHGERGAHPVNCVSGRDAERYCDWLGKRVPTAAEWDWIARGRGGAYPWGAEPIDDGRACWSGATPRDGTCEVGGRPRGASPEGVLDLVGDVAEWTITAAGEGESTFVARGGSWADRTPAASAGREGDVSQETGASGLAAPSPETRGLRCVAPPGQATRDVDEGAWRPLDPAPRELPVMVKRAPPRRPARALDHLAPLWHYVSDEDPAPTHLWQLGEEVVALDLAGARALQLATGVDKSAKPAALRDYWPRWIAEGMVLLGAGYSGDKSFISVDPRSYRIQWQSAPVASGRSYQHFVGPRTLVAEFYGDAADVVVGLALVDGRELWRLTGGTDAPFTRVSALWFDGDRGYVHGDRGLVALDPVTGAIAWSGVSVGEHCGVATGDGVLVVEAPDGQHAVINAATGEGSGRVQGRGRGECSWRGDGAPAAIAGGRLFAYDTPREGSRLASLRAYSLASGAELWSASKARVGPLVADADGVYMEGSRRALAARDPQTGRVVAEVSIGDNFTLATAHGGGPAGPLVVVTTETGGTWILGREEVPPVPEAFTITGRLVPDEYLRKRRRAGVGVTVGEHHTRTSAAGRFKIRGRAIGAVAVEMTIPPEQLEYSEELYSRELVRFDRVLVVLDGSGTYDVGDIPLYEWTIA